MEDGLIVADLPDEGILTGSVVLPTLSAGEELENLLGGARG
jgi:hypothetical protein